MNPQAKAPVVADAPKSKSWDEEQFHSDKVVSSPAAAPAAKREVFSIDGDNVDMSSFFDENDAEGGFVQVQEFNGPPYDTIELQTES
jgi:hypothetical protein